MRAGAEQGGWRQGAGKECDPAKGGRIVIAHSGEHPGAGFASRQPFPTMLKCVVTVLDSFLAPAGYPSYRADLVSFWWRAW